MSDSASDSTNRTGAGGGQRRSLGSWLAAMPRWEKLLLGVALLALVGGGIWSLLQGDPEPSTGSGGAGGGDLGGLGAGLVDSGTRGSGSAAGAAAAEPASKGFFRLGFSFLAGFCIGAFLRATLKIAAIAVGFWLLMTFVLSYVDIVQVDWNAMDSLWNRFTDNVQSEWGDFQQFMLGSLPATGLAITGFAVGLKRH